MVPKLGFGSTPQENQDWVYYRDRAVPFGDKPSGDYASCAKALTVEKFINTVPKEIQDKVKTVLLKCTYVDDGCTTANSIPELTVIQKEVTAVLAKGGFNIKHWETTGDKGETKFLGLLWNKKEDTYKLKFRLNFSKKIRGTPMEDDLCLEDLLSMKNQITKKNVLSVACQFYDPPGLCSPLLFTIRELYSSICRDGNVNMSYNLSSDEDKIFREAVQEMLAARNISFPRQIIFNGVCDLKIFFHGSLKGYGACVYVVSGGQSNLLTSSSKIMGKSKFCDPQSEMCSAVLAVKMFVKIKEELSSIDVQSIKFIGDSEIILRMIGAGNFLEFNIAPPPLFNLCC